MTTRLALGCVGVLVGAYGALLLLQQGLPNLLATLIWLAGGIVAHDFVWAPLVVLGAALGSRLTRPGARPFVTAALVVIATVTVSALPALGRFGAREDNSTLLDRNYAAGWVVLVGTVVLVTTVVGILHRSRGHSGPPT